MGFHAVLDDDSRNGKMVVGTECKLEPGGSVFRKLRRCYRRMRQIAGIIAGERHHGPLGAVARSSVRR